MPKLDARIVGPGDLEEIFTKPYIFVSDPTTIDKRTLSCGCNGSDLSIAPGSESGA